MRMVCPHCDAAYEVPEARLGAVRRLRCARCGQEWQIAAKATEPFAGPVPSFAPSAPPSVIFDALDGVPPSASAPAARPALAVAAPLVERGDRPGAPSSVLAGWGVTVLLLAALLTAGYVWRGPIKTAWPPSQRAYAAIGLN